MLLCLVHERHIAFDPVVRSPSMTSNGCALRPGRKVLPAHLPLSQPTSEVPTAKPSESPILILGISYGLEAIQKQIVRQALHVAGGNKARAAQLLGVSVRTIQRHIPTGRVHG